ncbi:hypothetical protein A6R68_07879 [Neotoma lepida]|uniref:Uncharacterized protein n=1 Tax=Neotoma lepida TaxID=56216 RepID=A0A1A6GCM8_NEOLE|nr:hypothetical protein A6R68_07879 [Neotoma lepida]
MEPYFEIRSENEANPKQELSEDVEFVTMSEEPIGDAEKNPESEEAFEIVDPVLYLLYAPNSGVLDFG